MAGMILPQKRPDSLEKELISSNLRAGECVFASGIRADNHLDLGFKEVSYAHRLQIVSQMGSLISREANFRPDFIAPVPTGAIGWANGLADFFALQGERPPVLEFEKVDRRVFGTPKHTREAIERLKDVKANPVGLVNDDATWDGGTSEVFAGHVSAEGLTVGLIASIYFRGHSELLRSDYPRAAVFARHIPAKLDVELFKAEIASQTL